MRLWTDGTTHVVLGADGVTVVRADGRRTLAADAPANGFDRGVLAVAPGARAIFARVGGVLRALAPDAAPPPAVVPPGAVALAPLDAGRVLAAVASEGDDDDAAPVHLALGPLAAPWTAANSARLAVPAPVTVAWPADNKRGRVWNEPRWSAATAGSRHWEITVNAFGAAAADQETGVLVVLPREAPGGAFAPAPYALRVPAEFPAADITAVATPQGVLVAHGGGRGIGGLNHFGPQGAHLAGRRTTGLASAPAACNAREVLLAVEETEHGTARVQVWTLDLPALEPREMLDTDLLAREGRPALAVAEDGCAFVLGDGAHVLWGRRGAGDAWETEPLVAG